MARLFGFSFEPPKAKRRPRPASFGAPVNDDGSMVVHDGGVGGSFFQAATLDLAPTFYDDVSLINRYREMAIYPEVDEALNDIVNETIIRDSDAPSVELVTDDLPGKFNSKAVRDTLNDEFEYLLDLLNFEENGYELFRQWYVDGRLYFHIVIDEQKPDEGIQELRMIDPRCIRPMREVRKELNANNQAWQVQIVNEYFVYNEMGIRMAAAQNQYQGVQVAKDSVAYIHSGFKDHTGQQIYSFLHKAIKPLNQLRMMEDSSVIYRLARAPERRMFYVDVGNLPKAKAEAYLQDVVNKYRNKLVYDQSTGEIKDDRKFMTMLEDFFLPRREGGKGTEVSNLAGGENLGKIEDIEYFKKRLYRSLNVPSTRFEQGGSGMGGGLGRSAEITRDEVRFARFLNRLRSRFSGLFDQLMARHLTLKNVIPNPLVWNELRKHVHYRWQIDSHYAELKELEILNGRLDALQKITTHRGVFFSDEWIKKNILKFSDDEMEEIDKAIEEEKAELEAEQQANMITLPDGTQMPGPGMPGMPGAGGPPGMGGAPPFGKKPFGGDSDGAPMDGEAASKKPFGGGKAAKDTDQVSDDDDAKSKSKSDTKKKAKSGKGDGDKS